MVGSVQSKELTPHVSGGFSLSALPDFHSTTGMNFPSKRITLAAGLGLLLLTSGCFDTKDDITLNPDGSGKVVHECTFQPVNLSADNENQDTGQTLTNAVREVLENPPALTRGAMSRSRRRMTAGSIFAARRISRTSPSWTSRTRRCCSLTGNGWQTAQCNSP